MMEKKAKADGVKVLYVIDENGRNSRFLSYSGLFLIVASREHTLLRYRFAVNQTKSIRIAIDLCARP